MEENQASQPKPNPNAGNSGVATIKATMTVGQLEETVPVMCNATLQLLAGHFNSPQKQLLFSLDPHRKQAVAVVSVILDESVDDAACAAVKADILAQIDKFFETERPKLWKTALTDITAVPATASNAAIIL